MTVLASTAFSGPFTPDGIVTAFPFTFAAASASEVQVVRRPASGADVAQVGYTVSVSSDHTGTVNFAVAPVAGDPLYILSSPSFLQQVSFPSQGAWSPSAMNAALDRAAERAIFLYARSNASVRAPMGEALTDLPSAANRVGKFMGFDAGGNPIALSGAGADASLRTDLAASTGTSLLAWLPAVGLTAMNLQTALRLGLPLMPEHFGAVGNGTSDDYAAFQALVTQVNTNLGGMVQFAHGKTYFINQNIASGNGIADIKFSGCNGLVIEGNGAKIKLKGSWDRDATTKRSITPLRFDDCLNVIVRNLEIDGNVNTITNSIANSTGLLSFGLSLNSCNRVLLENIYTHHHMLDGWRVDTSTTQIAGVYQASRNVTVRNVVSKFNVRLGASIIQVRGLLVEDSECSFTTFNNETGTTATFTNGGGPQAGVDVEPNSLPTSGSPVDVLTGEITFRRCRFVGSAGASFQCSSMTSGAYRTEHVNLEDCWFDHPDGVTGAGFTFDAADSTVSNCRFNMRDATLYFCWNAVGNAYQRFTGNTVYGRANATTGIITTQAGIGGRALIDNNTFIGTHTGALTAGNVPFRFINPYADVLRNHFFLPAAAYIDATGTDIMIAARQLGRRSEGNRYQTDLAAAAGSSAAAHYAVAYDLTNTVARAEKFIGAAIGWSDTFRPCDTTTSIALTWDSNFLFSSNQRMNKKTAHDWASLASGTQQSTTLTVTGAVFGDDVDTRMSIALSGTLVRGEVTAADTVTIYQSNLTGGAVDLGAGDIYATVTRRAA
jgi:hypothetical protein